METQAKNGHTEGHGAGVPRAQLDLRNGKRVVKQIGQSRITVSRVKSKTHRGGVTVEITVETIASREEMP